MAEAPCRFEREQQEPYDARVSRTVLWGAGGDVPLGLPDLDLESAVIKKLHFVYNVEATPQALVKDFVHRIVDPETYPCKLCDLTYGRFVKKPGWQMFLWSLPVKSAFYTKDVFFKRYLSERHHELPAILAEDERGKFSVFMSPEDFSGIPTLDALKLEVSFRLSRASAPNHSLQARRP